MANVNYVREHIQFMEYAADESLSPGEILLWHALMHIFNQRARGSDWPDGFVPVSRARLMTYCPMGYDTILKAREALRRRGLIDYEAGERNQRSPAYRIRYLCLEQGHPQPGPESYPQPGPGIANDPSGCTQANNEGYTQANNEGCTLGCPQGCTEKSYNTRNNTGDNVGDNVGDNTGDNTGDIYINDKHKHCDIPKPGVPRKEEEDTDHRTTSPARDALARSWKSAYGKSPPPAVANALLHRGLVVCGLDPPLLCEAVRMAALRCADSPVDYIFALFRDWRARKIRTLSQLEDFLEGEAGA